MDALKDSSLIIILTFFVFGITVLVWRRSKN